MARMNFMFQLTMDEADAFRFQFGTLNRGQHFKYLPNAITAQGGLSRCHVLAINSRFIGVYAVYATRRALCS